MTDETAADRSQAVPAPLCSPASRGFVLHERLQADTIPIGRLALSRLLLMNDATYPWLILVPQRPDVHEIIDLAAADRATLMEEIVEISRALAATLHPDKLNVAAIGNLVPQLHVHVVARFRSDPVWPAPIWGRTPPRPYSPAAGAEMRAQLSRHLPSVLPAD